MTFTAVGSLVQSTTSSLSLNPSAVGNFYVVEVICSGTTTIWASSISGGNCSWVQAGTHYAGSSATDTAAMFIGTATATGSSTATVTFNTGSPTIRAVAFQFSTSFSSVAVDTTGHIDISGGAAAMPSVTPAGSGELYFAFAYNAGTGSGTGATSGYTYGADSHGNDYCYNTNCSSSTQSPTTNDNNGNALGMAALIMQGGTSVTASAGLASASGAAYQPATSALLTPGLASATGAPYQPQQGVSFTAGLASASAAAYNASATGSTPGTANPGAATAAAAAYGPVATVTGLPAAAAAAGAAYRPQTSGDPVNAGFAGATAAVYQPLQGGSPSAGFAGATAAAYQPLQSGLLTAGLAGGTGAAYNAFIPLQSTGAAVAAAAAYSAVAAIRSPGLEVYGFGTFPQVPAGYPVYAVIANVAQYGTNTTIAPSYELWDGTTARIGSPVAGSTSVTPGNRDSVVFTGVSYAQLATLRLRVYASSGAGNSGATLNVDAVSLSVNWAPELGVTVQPAVLAVIPVTGGGSPGAMAPAGRAPGIAAAYPVTVQAFLSPVARPVTLAVVPALPAVSSNAAVTPARLAVTPAVQVIADVTLPGWGASEDIQGSGTASWATAGNVTGSPDGSYATWTVP